MNKRYTIESVFIAPSEYRMNDFDIKGKECDRWSITFKAKDHYYDDDYPEEAPHYQTGVLYFTTYHLEERYRENTPEAAYKFFIDHMEILIKCHELDNNHISLYTNKRNPFNTPEYSDCHYTEGFAYFMEKFWLSVPLYGQPMKQLFKDLQEREYIYYSSMKLLSYAYDGNLCEVFESYGDMENFLNNPPLMAKEPIEETY